ncbi:TlpA family protein disulfide reductase [Flavobacterium aquidurense]|uniref:TlpA family protein disulfide reductase n=1 Tax=Flavobacterium aquidurense TaxID=362413 RepID=UPI00371F1D4D
MKKLLFILAVAVSIAACGSIVPRDYVTLQGKISNKNSDSLVIGQRSIIKTIKVGSDGTFSDTLKVKPGLYVIFDGSEQTKVYLKNGYDLKVSVDAKKFDHTIKYNGNGANANNYLAEKTLLEQKLLDYDSIISLKKPDFDIKMQVVKSEMYSLLEKAKALDTSFVRTEKMSIDQVLQQTISAYEEKQSLLALNGKSSPKFNDYENFAGGMVSFDDLKGKYVYIDLWATWCGPCKAEIPYLKDIEKKYHSGNIKFVSISIDKKTSYEKWRKMVKEMELSGIQLYANEDESFMKSYMVTGIPRFILIDPQGLIISADAPRPSDKALVELLSTYKI